MLSNLNEFWSKQFQEHFPVFPLLKNMKSRHWLRFHLFDDSRRRPANEGEMNECLNRYMTVLHELQDDSEHLFVIAPEYSESPKPSQPKGEVVSILPDLTPWISMSDHDEDDDYELYWHFHVAETNSESERIVKLFRLVAEDELRNLLVISPRSEFVFHPYDGGMDVFLSDLEALSRLEEKFSHWLAPK